MTPYHKNEWYDYDSKITVGDVIELPNMSFGLVSKVMIEETEDTYGNLLGTADEYVVTCLYTGKSSTVSEREKPVKIHTEYLNEILTTAPYHRWIYENYEEFYSKDTYWMDWFCATAAQFEVTIRSYVEAADRLLALEGATWEREYPSQEWQDNFWRGVEQFKQANR